jgi:hypothetical protein
MEVSRDIQLVTTGSINAPNPGFITMYMNTDGKLYLKRPDGSQALIS